MTFTATGDSFITRTLPLGDALHGPVGTAIRLGEARFTNLEVTIRGADTFPSAASGGTWGEADPRVLQDLYGAYGFNLVAWANNHTLDYSYGGLEATRGRLAAFDWTYAGVGVHLADASAPRYLECPSGRVALLAATSTFHDCWAAGEQRPDMAGRPGVNPLRHTVRYRLTRSRLQALQDIAEATGINARTELSEKEGYRVPPSEGTFRFGNDLFVAAEEDGKETACAAGDLARLLQSVREAARRADYVVVSLHSHEMRDRDKGEPADFYREAAKACIDAGAHAVVGHGPHVLRGIELYRKRPIFYSLGNFIFQNETVERLPADFYEKYGLGHGDGVAEAFEARKALGKHGLGGNAAAWESVVAYWEMEAGELRGMKLYPIQLGAELPSYRKGWPARTDSISVFERVEALCRPYGTKVLRVTDGTIDVIV
jgi:hypothetical protein